MATDLEEMVSDSIEDIGMDAVIERQQEQKQTDKARWEGWVALSSSLLAVLSAIAALYATFAADEAATAESHETVAAAYTSGAEASYNALRAKRDILVALGQPVDTADEAAINEYTRQIKSFRERSRNDDRSGGRKYETHDHLTIAVALFQVAILLGGLAVVVQRPALWTFGMTFVVSGLWFMVWGLVSFLS